jgi:threonine synthase
MRYISTRGQAPELDFTEVLLAGLATDGGLYLPTYWPALHGVEAGSAYADVAAAVMEPFVGDAIGRDDFSAMCSDAYGTFRHPAVTPLVQIDVNTWLLELFHGPTLAFKDVALQLVGRLFDYVLAQQSRRITILGATSGDTGSAAIDGLKACKYVDVVILYPQGRMSDVQRRQMTTVDAPNVHAVAVEGTFDDCQDLVKAAFADQEFRERVSLSAVNSINWARIMAQVVYYVTAWQALGERELSFTVPTGNFGNVFSGWVAMQMGVPVSQFVVGSNTNDILTRFLETSSMTTTEVVPTLSPSMDIQVSSNFERLLFEVNERDGGMTNDQMRRFRSMGSLQVEPDQFQQLTRHFSGVRVDDTDTSAIMADVYATTGVLVDPHTAVGIGASRRTELDRAIPNVVLATAHPAKFPDAVEQATGIRPPLPAHLADLFERPERTALLPNDLAAVQVFVDRVRTA